MLSISSTGGQEGSVGTCSLQAAPPPRSTPGSKQLGGLPGMASPSAGGQDAESHDGTPSSSTCRLDRRDIWACAGAGELDSRPARDSGRGAPDPPRVGSSPKDNYQVQPQVHAKLSISSAGGQEARGSARTRSLPAGPPRRSTPGSKRLGGLPGMASPSAGGQGAESHDGTRSSSAGRRDRRDTRARIGAGEPDSRSARDTGLAAPGHGLRPRGPLGGRRRGHVANSAATLILILLGAHTRDTDSDLSQTKLGREGGCLPPPGLKQPSSTTSSPPPTPLGKHSEQDKREGQQDRSGEGSALISKCYNHTAVDRPAGA